MKNLKLKTETMSKTNLTPQQKKTLWQFILWLLGLLFRIGRKHVERHTGNDDKTPAAEAENA